MTITPAASPKITPFLWFDTQAEEAMLKMGKIDVAMLQQAHDRV